jgi:hypothetical protein
LGGFFIVFPIVPILENNLSFIILLSSLSTVSLLFENENIMNALNKAKKELVNELQELRKEHNELKALYGKTSPIANRRKRHCTSFPPASKPCYLPFQTLS